MGIGQANIDVGIFQETKLAERIYTYDLAVYSAVATLVPIQHRGSIALFYRDPPYFSFEAIQKFGVNIIEGQLAMEERRWYIIIFYLVPREGATIQDVDMAMGERPRGTELIAAEDLKLEFERTGGQRRDEDIAALVTMAGLEDLLEHFLPQW